ncbi:MAG: aminoglycoside phosphotransferase family protein [Pacificibacter sp.]|uniref:aminoglycoside phosphotransferase family protein n=1 Tax=Pacificibacter sp. TaxID=1917866 RepID=UPI00321A2BD6
MDVTPHLTRFGATNPTPLTQTPRAHLWRVDTRHGPAVLKVLTPEGLDARELEGAEALRLWDGKGAVKLLGLSDHAMLLDWLPGPSLGDMARGGQDLESAALLADVALTLSGPPQPAFDDLRTYGMALTRAKVADVPAPYRDAFSRAQALWPRLLDSTTESRLLHADLHHDNILQGANGWCAIDPKGVNGDPCYEFANALKNPDGMEAEIKAPTRIVAMAQLFARIASLDEARILQFGFAHAALSLSWHMERGDAPEPSLTILNVFHNLICTPLP